HTHEATPPLPLSYFPRSGCSDRARSHKRRCDQTTVARARLLNTNNKKLRALKNASQAAATDGSAAPVVIPSHSRVVSARPRERESAPLQTRSEIKSPDQTRAA